MSRSNRKRRLRRRERTRREREERERAVGAASLLSGRAPPPLEDPAPEHARGFSFSDLAGVFDGDLENPIPPFARPR